jgi:hypothetical protein
MKRDPRDLLGEFRALAPPREPIALQRWGTRRVALAVTVLVVLLAAVEISVSAFKPAGNLGTYPPVCGTGHSMILSAQAVPSAAKLPCVAALPSGWTVGGTDVGNGHAQFWLDSDEPGAQAAGLRVTARPHGAVCVRASRRLRAHSSASVSRWR